MPPGFVPLISDINSAKALGAFYTDQRIADFLVWWSIRRKTDRAIDPSFGGGVFLFSAAERVGNLGGTPESQVFGVEIDTNVHRDTAASLSPYRVSAANLIRADFFDVLATDYGRFDAVIGNPPFIRYQRFTGEAREKGLRRAAESGVTLNQLCSSWAPFLIHSIQLLNDGGRLAMVIPSEVMHAAYAQPVLRHLEASFREITFLTFREKLFPELNEDTLLLLAEDRRNAERAIFRLRDLQGVSDLTEIQRAEKVSVDGTIQVNAAAVRSGSERLIEYLIPKSARDLYRDVRNAGICNRLGYYAAAGIGYVTGANFFFHLSIDDVVLKKIDPRFLKVAVWRGRAFRGIRFSLDDYENAITQSDAGFLLAIPPETKPTGSLARYLAVGDEAGVPTGFKCRNRKPWYVVPHVYIPDGFLSYMSGGHPQFVSNEAGAVAPNTLHIVRLRRNVPNGASAIAAGWHTSLTHLSVEIEGHSMGGGMLKLEPTEAERVCLPTVDRIDDLRSTIEELDELTRKSRADEAQAIADDRILRKLGLNARDCAILRQAAESLRNRRNARGLKNGINRRRAPGGRLNSTAEAVGEKGVVGGFLEVLSP